MALALIGISPRVVVDGDTTRENMSATYPRALAKFGLHGVMLPVEGDASVLFPLFSGFLVTGGNDTDPRCYHAVDQGVSTLVPPEVDALDKAMVEYAVSRHLPMLGICRGIQSINVFMGGTLFQDIKNHRSIAEGHEVTTFPNPYFPLPAEILTNSYHHQALDRVAEGLEVIARHHDGTIEMVVGKSLPIIGTQFHPEMRPDDPVSIMIFTTFKRWLEEGYQPKDWS